MENQNPETVDIAANTPLAFGVRRLSVFWALFIGKWKEATMSIAEIIPAVRALSRGEKLQLAQMLLEDLGSEQIQAGFKEGQVYPIYTPEYAPNAAAQLAQLLNEEGARS